MSNKDTNETPDNVEGYISNETEVPCLGHLGFFAVFQGTVRYPELVAQARSEGITLSAMDTTDAQFADRDRTLHSWSEYVPSPRSGSRAFAYAVKELEYKVGWVENDAWQDARGRNYAHLSYEVVMIRGQREFKLVRRYRGFNVERQEWDSVTEDLFRLRYVHPARDSSLRSWTSRYVAQSWGMLEEGTGKAEMRDLADLIEVTAYDANVLVDANLLTQVTQRLLHAMEAECTTVDQDGLRRVIRNAILNHNGVQFGGSSGGVYYIPDFERNQSYLETLVPFSNLINWFGEMNRRVQDEDSLRFDEEGNRIEYDNPTTTFRLLGYVDSPRQMEYLRQDIAREIGRSVNEYYDKLLKIVRETDIENLPRELDRLVIERENLSRKLGNMSSVVGEATNQTNRPMGDVVTGIEARLSAISDTDSVQAGRIRRLLNLDFNEE